MMYFYVVSAEVTPMEIDISGVGVNPKNMDGEQEFTIRMGESGDTVVTEERPTNDGKGKFVQYTLFLKDKDGVDKELRFLFGKDLNPLIAEWGKETKVWEHQKVNVTPTKEGEFYRVILDPAPLTA